MKPLQVAKPTKTKNAMHYSLAIRLAIWGWSHWIAQ